MQSSRGTANTALIQGISWLAMNNSWPRTHQSLTANDAGAAIGSNTFSKKQPSCDLPNYSIDDCELQSCNIGQKTSIIKVLHNSFCTAVGEFTQLFILEIKLYHDTFITTHTKTIYLNSERKHLSKSLIWTWLYQNQMNMLASVTYPSACWHLTF